MSVNEAKAALVACTARRDIILRYTPFYAYGRFQYASRTQSAPAGLLAEAFAEY